MCVRDIGGRGRGHGERGAGEGRRGREKNVYVTCELIVLTSCLVLSLEETATLQLVHYPATIEMLRM